MSASIREAIERDGAATIEVDLRPDLGRQRREVDEPSARGRDVVEALQGCLDLHRRRDAGLHARAQQLRELVDRGEIARLLHHDVDVFVLDEPTRGIDVGSKAQIYELIDSLVASTDGRPPRAVLMVSSYVPELLGLCDRVAVMCRGTLSVPRPVAEWTEHTLMLAATGTGDAA